VPAERSDVRDGVKDRLLAVARLTASAVPAGAATGNRLVGDATRVPPNTDAADGPPGAAVLFEVEPVGGPRRAAAPTELRLATLRPGAQPPRHDPHRQQRRPLRRHRPRRHLGQSPARRFTALRVQASAGRRAAAFADNSTQG